MTPTPTAQEREREIITAVVDDQISIPRLGELIREAITAAEQAAREQRDAAWQSDLEDRAVVDWTYEKGKTPREMIHKIISANVHLALDPKVSEEARFLQQAARDEIEIVVTTEQAAFRRGAEWMREQVKQLNFLEKSDQLIDRLPLSPPQPTGGADVSEVKP